MTETQRGMDTAAPTCPSCGSVDVAKILYGMPIFDDNLEHALREGRLVLGGCVVSSGIATHQCNVCNQRFGSLSLRHWSLPTNSETIE